MLNKKYFSKLVLISALIIIVAAAGITVSAAGIPFGRGNGNGWHGSARQGSRPAAVGQLVSNSGTTLIVAERGFGKNAATTTLTVDASAATVVLNFIAMA